MLSWLGDMFRWAFGPSSEERQQSQAQKARTQSAIDRVTTRVNEITADADRRIAEINRLVQFPIQWAGTTTSRVQHRRKIVRRSLLMFSWVPLPQVRGAPPMRECRIIPKTDFEDRSLCHVYRHKLRIVRKGKNSGPMWEFANMPEDLANLCRSVVRDGAEGPWRQIGDWILQNEDLVPKSFWKAFVEMVNVAVT